MEEFAEEKQEREEPHPPKRTKPVPGRRPFGGAHVLQSALGGIYIFFVFLAMNSFESNLTVASLGASTFIAFSFPHTQSARVRFLVGGYCVGSASGLLGAGIILLLERYASVPIPAYIVGCALTVFLVMFLMSTLNFEHPPSAALAVAVATAARPVMLGLAAIACVAVLCLIRYLLRSKLKNL